MAAGNSVASFAAGDAGSRDPSLPSMAVDATGLPVIRTAPHSASIALASAKSPI